MYQEKDSTYSGLHSSQGIQAQAVAIPVYEMVSNRQI